MSYTIQISQTHVSRDLVQGLTRRSTMVPIAALLCKKNFPQPQSTKGVSSHHSTPIIPAFPSHNTRSRYTWHYKDIDKARPRSSRYRDEESSLPLIPVIASASTRQTETGAIGSNPSVFASCGEGIAQKHSSSEFPGPQSEAAEQYWPHVVKL